MDGSVVFGQIWSQVSAGWSLPICYIQQGLSGFSLTLLILSVVECFSVFVPVCLYQLLDFEARSGEQVPLLLKMKRSQLALSKAVESGDTDLGECFSPTPYVFARWMMSH